MLGKRVIALFAPLAVLACAGSAAAATVKVTKAASCACCHGWVEHMRKAGFTVEVTEVDDVTPTAEKLGVPAALRSCHSSEVEGYVVEGHVPAADVKRLLSEHPQARGIAVPGMVMGSPGMEMGGHSEPYRVVLFDKSGKTSTFASH